MTDPSTFKRECIVLFMVFFRINGDDTFSRFNDVQQETYSTTMQNVGYAGKTMASHVRNFVDSDFAMLSL